MIVPLNITFKEWASQIRIDYPSVTFPFPPSQQYWRNWASQVINSNSLINVPLPTKLGYPNDNDWKQWASYFVSSL